MRSGLIPTGPGARQESQGRIQAFTELLVRQVNIPEVIGVINFEAPAGAPHIAAMKAYSIRNDSSRTLRELANIRMLLDAPGVDRAEVNG